jgi:hypothetical protein
MSVKLFGCKTVWKETIKETYVSYWAVKAICWGRNRNDDE